MVRPADVAAVLANRHQIGQPLARMRQIGERIDDRHAGVRSQRLDAAVRRPCAARWR